MNKKIRSPQWAISALSASFVVLFVLIALASFMPGMRLWGANHLAFYSLPVRLIALALIALAFVPGVARLLYTGLLVFFRQMLAGSTRSWLIAVLAVIAVLIFLILMRVEIPLLSEGRFLTSLVNQENATTSDLTVSVYDVLEHERLAPGTMILYLIVWKLGFAVTEWGLAGNILILNLVLLAVFMLSLIQYAIASRMTPSLAALFLVVLVLSGTAVLFTGYLTKYAPFLICGALYIVSAFRYLHRRCSFKVPLLLFILAFMMHIFGALLLPSFIYLLVHYLRGEQSSGRNKQIMLAILALTAGLAVTGAIIPHYRIYYLPLLGTSEADGILSPGHIADIFNILLLALPALPLLLSVPSINRKLTRDAREHTSNGEAIPEKARAHHILESHCALLLLLPWMLFLLLFKPEVTFAREWDRYILSSLGTMPFMFVGLKQLFRHIGAEPVLQTGNASSRSSGLAVCIAPALVITLVMTVSWLGINSSPQKSEARYEQLLAFEKMSAAGGYERLYYYYSTQEKLLKAGEAAERAYDLSPTPSNSLNLSLLRVAMEDTLGAIEMLTETLRNNPSAHMIRHELITLLDQTDRYRELIQVSKNGTEQEPDEPQYYYFIGKGHLYLGNLMEGIDALRICKEMNPPQPILDNINTLMGRIHKKQ